MKGTLYLFSAIAGVLMAQSSDGAVLQNENFGNGLTDWIHSVGVFEGLGKAAITDENSTRSILYQGVSLEIGSYEVEIEYSGNISAVEPTGFAKDTFFASLYFTSTPELFDPVTTSGFDLSIPLFDLDAGGTVLFTGELEQSQQQDFSIFSGSFALGTPLTVFVVFELSDLNGINDNSLVLLDYVQIVPEPTTISLVMAVLSLAGVIMRRRIKG